MISKFTLPTINVYIFLIVLVIIEGFGLPYGRIVSRYLCFIVPLVFLGIDLIFEKKITIPIKASVLFLCFIFAAALSTLTAVHKQIAFEHQLYYIGIYLNFIYVYNHKQEFKNSFPLFVSFITLLVLFSIPLFNFVLPQFLSVYTPASAFQFVILHTGSNNHYAFGAFILIPLVYYVSKFWIKQGFFSAISILVLTALLLVSFLRAAYVSFVLIIFIQIFMAIRFKKNIRLRYIMYIGVLIGITVLAGLLVTTFDHNIPFIGKANTVLSEHFEKIRYKSLLNGRLEFIQQSIQAIVHRPITGFGTYNYYYASMRFASSYVLNTGSSHNLFLDIFVENGVVGGVSFVLLISLLIKNGSKYLSEKSFYSIIYILFLSILILFQFGHYHKMYFLFAFFLTLAGLFYKESDELEDSYNGTFLISLILFIICFFMIQSFFFIKLNKAQIAVKLYPISTIANQASIAEYIQNGDRQKAAKQLNEYTNLYSENPDILSISGDIFKKLTLEKDALNKYVQALSYSPDDLTYLIKIYEQLEIIEDQKVATKYVEDYVHEHNTYTRNTIQQDTKWFYEWCETKKIKCIE